MPLARLLLRLAAMARVNFGSLSFLLSLALGIAACTGDKGDEETGSTGDAESTDGEMPTTGAMDSESAGSSETGEPLPDNCACKSGDPCSMSLCPKVRWVDQDNDEELDAELVDPFMTASTCALEQLRDGEAGTISWDYVGYGGQYSEHGTNKLFGDGTALRSNGGAADLCSYVVDEIVLGPVKDSQFFADCLALTDTRDRFSCVRGAGEGLTAICQAGEQNCDGV